MSDLGVTRAHTDRWVRLIDSALTRPVVLIQAPAGYGKTTAVKEWLREREPPVAWLTMTEQDNDPLSLAGRLTAAITPLLSGPGPRPVQAAPELKLTWLPDLANCLRESAPAELVVVFDGYEVVGGEQSNDLVRSLLDVIWPAARVVITTRTKPALRLARRVVGGGLTSVNEGQLALTREELESIIAAQGHVLGAEQLTELHAWSGGWPVAAAIFAATGHQQSAAGFAQLLLDLTSGPVSDYVATVVLADLPAPARELLLGLAAIGRFSDEMAKAVVDVADVQRSLTLLRDQAGLVLPVDWEGKWLAVHPQLRAPLLAISSRTESDRAGATQAAATDWLERRGLVAEAIDNAVTADDAELAARLIADHAITLVAEGKSRRTQDALELLAADDRWDNELNESLRVVIDAEQGDDPAQARRAAKAFLDRPSTSQDAALLARLVLSSPDAGQVGEAITAGWAALAACDAASPLRGELMRRLGLSLWLSGNALEARELLVALVGLDIPGRHRITAHAVLALVAAEAEDVQLAERYARAGAELAAHEPDEYNAADVALAYGSLAEALRLSGRLEDAREALDRGRVYAPAASLRAGILDAFDAQLAIAERRRDEARLSAERARAILGSFPDPGSGISARLTQIIATLEHRIDSAPPGSMPTPAEMRVLEVLAVQRSRSQIARQLFLSETTVKSHLRRLYRRLGASNRDEALAAAHARGLLPAARPLDR